MNAEDSTARRFLRERMFVDGVWIDADDGATIPVSDPASGEIIGTVPRGGAGETARAIASAHAAFQTFKTTTADTRAQMLRALAQTVQTHHEPLAQLLTLEQGKPLAQARAEIDSSARYIQWFAEEARRAYGDIIPSPWTDRQLLVTRVPVGVVGAITPWNFPSSMLARKIGPALAAGCTMVIKPASQTPFSALAWGLLAQEAGLPDGVINIVTGQASDIGGELTGNPLVRKITFTGSTEVGRTLMEQAARSVKRVSMELGGNAPFIVFDDADIDRAVAGAIASKFRNSGQTCVCTNRFYVQAGIHDAFVERLSAAAAALRIGPGLAEQTEQGPLIDTAAIDRVQAMLADATAKGGTVVCGGGPVAQGPLFFEPTVVTGAHAKMDLAREEIFGPIAPIFRFETEAEALTAANATEFGLACYLYTGDLGRAVRLSEAFEYGIVGVNEGFVTTEVAPFGGVKQSGIGREGSKYGMDDYLERKYICLAP